MSIELDTVRVSTMPDPRERSEGDLLARGSFSQDINRATNIVITGMAGAGKRTLMRNLFLQNCEDKQAALISYTQAVFTDILSSMTTLINEVDVRKFKPGEKERFDETLAEAGRLWTPDVGRALQKICRAYLREIKAVAPSFERVNHHMEVMARAIQPDYTPTLYDCLMVTGDAALESSEFTLSHGNTEYNFYRVDADQLSTIENQQFIDNTTLLVNVMDCSLFGDEEEVEKAMHFHNMLNRIPALNAPGNKFMTVPIVMLFNRTDAFDRLYETRRLDLKEGFPNFKGRRNLDTAKDFIKGEFYAQTYGDRDVFSCFKSAVSINNDIMTSIIKACDNVSKKRELSKILKLSSKPSIQRILAGEDMPRINLGNPDSYSRLMFENIAWRDLSAIAHELQPPSPLVCTELNLRNNGLGPRGAQILASTIVSSRTLSVLKLGCNNIQDEGASVIATMLERNQGVLTTLNLNSNAITSEGARALALALVRNNSLTMLDLSDNLLDNPAGVALVSAVQANKRLRVLNLWRNRISDLLVLEQLYFANHTLTELNVAENPALQEPSLPRIISLLSQNQTSALVTLNASILDTWRSWSHAPLDSPDGAQTGAGGAVEYITRLDQTSALRVLLDRNRSRTMRNGTNGLEVLERDPAAYAVKQGDEIMIDWGNFGISGRLQLSTGDTFGPAASNLVTQLCLDHNDLAEFPMEVTTLPALRSLVVSFNILSAIPPEICNLKNLARLDLSNNKLTSLPSAIGTIITLQMLDIRFNQIHTLCDEVCNLTNLEWLFVQQNPLTTLPMGVFRLTRLRHLDCAGTSIPDVKGIIYNAWVNKLKDLSMAELGLASLPIEIGQLTQLTRLSLAYNKLISLPPVMGNLTNLQFLDLTENVLESLPWQLGGIKPLKDLLLAGNPLSQIPMEVRDKDVGYLKDFLLTLSTGEEECFRMKLMLVGAENVGKTSSSRCLREEIASDKKRNANPSAPSTISTDGIDIGQWDYEEEGMPTINFSIWDFAGQEVYYSTHQFFLSQRSLYIIVFNMMLGDETSRLEYWLQSIKVAAKTAPVVIVGTHADHPRCTPEYIENLAGVLQQKFTWRFKNIRGFFPVSCKTRKGFDLLRNNIVQAARTQPGALNKFPRSHLQLERLVLSERRLRTPPVVSMDQFADMATQCGAVTWPKPDASGPSAQAGVMPRTLDKIVTIMRPLMAFLNELGVVIWMDDPKLYNVIIIDPHWLAKLMSTLITSKMNFVANGVLERKNLTFLWKAPDFPESLHGTLLDILERFEIMYRIPADSDQPHGTSAIPGADERYLLMCLVNDKRPPLEFPRPGVERPQVVRIYQMPFVPLGLMSKLMTRTLHFVRPLIYWKDGMVAETDACEVLIEYQSAKNQIRLHLVGTEIAATVRLLMENIDNLIEGYYRIQAERQLMCSHCIEKKDPTPYMFPLNEVETAAALGKDTVNCQLGGTQVPVRIAAVAPDLVMADLEHLKINFADVQMHEVLGEGAFGIVYRATYKNEVIAFKQLNMTGGADPAELYGELRREVWLSSALNHPNIVGLRGMCFNPCGMAMEYMPHGNLYSWLRTDQAKDLSWDMRLRIALDLASAMRFLHNATPKIIHRDFKSPNVLMVMDEKVACKVSDFGASRAVAKCFGREDLGNPSWLAPEVMRGTGEAYTEKADTFSYGIVLWELITKQHPYSEYPISTGQFMGRFEEAIIAGLRPTVPPDTPAEFTEVITRCWDGEPSRRPSFDAVYLILARLRRRLNPSLPVTDEERILDAQAERARVAIVPKIDIRQSRQSLRYGGSTNYTLSPSATSPASTLGNPPLMSAGSERPPHKWSKSNSEEALLLDGSPSSTPSSSTNTSPTTQHLTMTMTKTRSKTSTLGRGVTKRHLSDFSAEDAQPEYDGVPKYYFTKQLDPRLTGIRCLAVVGDEMWGGCLDGSLVVWNMHSFQVMEERDTHHETVSCMLYDGKQNVWTGSSDGSITIWDAKSGKKKKTLKAHDHEVTCLVLTRKYVWSGSLDEKVRVWDVKSFSSVRKISEIGPVHAMTVQENRDRMSARQIIEGGAEVFIWVAAGKKVVTINGRSMKVHAHLDGHNSKINCIASINDQIWSCGSDGSVIVWHAETQEVIDEVEYPHEILCLVPARNRCCIYAGTKTKLLSGWNTRTLKVTREQPRHDGPILALALGGPNQIWSGSEDRTACIWQETDEDPNMTLSLASSRTPRG
eukprot:TRINITY_DN2678_c0_g1_i3.p1 TRINITY_DN2678_c0_g1~~TRINITY_DN2678_c0_g1_i3.p1  ORF type:complete len:2207 (+),score=796.21 TRINITY_DN2678_c0_g1_i3:224-6844(+)